MNAYSIFPLGDQCVSFEFLAGEINPDSHQKLIAMKRWLENNSFEGMSDLVLGYRSISVTFDLFRLAIAQNDPSGFQFVSKKLREAFAFATNDKTLSATRAIRIPVCYSRKFGFDIDAVCQRNSLTQEELVHLHTSVSYNVYLIGFLPGFPYLGFVDPRLEMPRHPAPRASVPAGSVGIAGKQTGVYPTNSPGGWQIIGRTPIKLFDPLQTPPVTIEPGDTVSFVSIDEEEFDRLKKAND